MTVSSEYGFRIFVSSTDYNLIDLRAELAKYLSDLGYTPILSSADGFHDNSPELEPWESCLQVLQSVYVMVLVIDGKYGKRYEWKNFSSVIGEKKVSPTHAEYLFAHKTKMRMLVFIRKELLSYYEVYKTTLKNCNDDKEETKKVLSKSLPKHVEFEALEFIADVKTTAPIPWIKPFENVTDIKREIQKKMLNELSEIFLFKNKHLAAVIRAFSTVLNELPEEKRKEILAKVGVTKELVGEIENQTKVISGLKKDKVKLQKELTKKGKELNEAQKAKKKETGALEARVQSLSHDLDVLNSRIYNHELNNANYLISGSGVFNPSLSAISSSPMTLGTSSQPIGLNLSGVENYLGNTGFSGVGGIFYATPQCDKCHNAGIGPLLTYNPLRECPSCKRNLCTNCYEGFTTQFTFSDKCSDCRNNKTA